MVQSPKLTRERLVRQCLRRHKARERVTEQIRIPAVIETKFEFIDAAVKMLVRYLMERSDDSALQLAKAAVA